MKVPNSAAVAWQTFLGKVGLRQDLDLDLPQSIVPVALLDSEVAITALVSSPVMNVPFSAGETIAPAVNTRLANTGAQVAGQYNVIIAVHANETQAFRLRRRNAADNADVWSTYFIAGSSSGGDRPIFDSFRVVLNTNEFLVIENAVVGSAGKTYQASIWLQGPF